MVHRADGGGRAYFWDNYAVSDWLRALGKEDLASAALASDISGRDLLEIRDVISPFEIEDLLVAKFGTDDFQVHKEVSGRGGLVCVSHAATLSYIT